MQKTFVIFKPDTMEKRIVGTVLSRFEAAGFDVIGCKMARLSSALLREHYENLPQKLQTSGIDPRVPWLYNFKLDFRFR